MGFVDAVKTFYRRYTDFQGRSSRSEYWWVQLYFWLVLIVFYVLAIAAVGMGGGFENLDASMEGDAAMPIGAIIMFSILGLFFIANIIPGIALVVRRFHDLDRSGWFYLLFVVLSIIPLIGFIASIVMIVWFCTRGTVGANRFGMDPLGPGIETFD